MPQIDVNLTDASYSITIEPGLLHRTGRAVLDVAPSKVAIIAVDANLAATYAQTIAGSLQSQGYRVAMNELVADEAHKSLDAVRELYEAMLAARLERGSPVIALGGGVIGDVAGFAAATYARGIPVIQVPTTLLAMVDASIGGKTGVNLGRRGEPFIKNLVGAFWQPRAVLIDPEVLETLEPREFRCGLAECVKHAMIGDVDLLAFLAENSAALASLDMDVLSQLIERSARIKVALVERDEREANVRALLNLGHTFAHAMEPIPELDLKHGEAVAIGLAAAMHCAVQTDWMQPGDEQLVLDLLQLLELPARLPRPISVTRLMDAMSHDKKVARGTLRLVLPRGLGAAEIADNIPTERVIESWLHIGAAAAEASSGDEFERILNSSSETSIASNDRDVDDLADE